VPDVLGLERNKRPYYRWNGGPWMPGVTSIIKMLDKSDVLIGWAKKVTAKAALRNLNDLLILTATPGGDQMAYNLLVGAPDLERDTAADLGTRVHTFAEAVSRGETPEEAQPSDVARCESYIRWRERYQPRFIQIEYMVYSLAHNYGGTGDAMFYLDNPATGKEELWSVDYKTGKGAYPETALQLSGLDGADFIGVPGSTDMIALPKAQRYGVLWVTDAGAELIEYRVTDVEWQAFLACRLLWEWVHAHKATIQTRGVLS
jgi:hypothetical protein